ncbi:MAG TPA: hypothetical protein VHM00_07675 [Caldimonas sp.]|jgi:hypothetical protein|nr:hypothetical protein [Caldimonas sp.]HEX2540947.1 hypothetical protein [Caldimonas sp.]
MFALVRRRQVWLPTWQGWLLIAAALAAALVIGAQRIVGFLAVSEPAPGARILVVEGWLEQADLRQAIAAYKRGGYERVLTTGGPVESWSDPPGLVSSAVRAAGFIASKAPPGLTVTPVPAPAADRDRTFLSAVALRDWARREGVTLGAIDLFTAGVHARRSRMMFAEALGPSATVGVLAAPVRDWDPARWWASSNGAKTVVGESLGLAWTVCCFRAPASASPAEQYGTRAAPP